eukprot:934782_1
MCETGSRIVSWVVPVLLLIFILSTFCMYAVLSACLQYACWVCNRFLKPLPMSFQYGITIKILYITYIFWSKYYGDASTNQSGLLYHCCVLFLNIIWFYPLFKLQFDMKNGKHSDTYTFIRKGRNTSDRLNRLYCVFGDIVCDEHAHSYLHKCFVLPDKQKLQHLQKVINVQFMIIYYYMFHCIFLCFGCVYIKHIVSYNDYFESWLIDLFILGIWCVEYNLCISSKVLFISAISLRIDRRTHWPHTLYKKCQVTEIIYDTFPADCASIVCEYALEYEWYVKSTKERNLKYNYPLYWCACCMMLSVITYVLRFPKSMVISDMTDLCQIQMLQFEYDWSSY